MKTNNQSRPAAKKRATVPAAADKLDLGKRFRAEYAAPRKPVLLHTVPSRYLAIAGQGAPGGEVFQARTGALYAIAYTVKMTRRFGGVQDYTISNLEGRYLNLGCDPMPPKEQWRWQLLIRTPEFVTAEELARALAALRKRGKEADAAMVHLETIAEGRCVQMLHVGPYEKEGDTVAAMAQFVAGQGLRCAGPHHEIYLSDPRRVAPGKLKTILRLPVIPV